VLWRSAGALNLNFFAVDAAALAHPKSNHHKLAEAVSDADRSVLISTEFAGIHVVPDQIR